MNWKDKLSEIESAFGRHEQRDWKPVIKLVQDLMTKYPENVEANVRAIHLLHNILVEEEYSDSEQQIITDLLIKYFNESQQRFCENSEYLFFIGKILHIAEWYFGINEEMKTVEETLAFKMQKKAFEKEPDNQLYEWAYLFSKDEKKKAFTLSKQILYEGNNWLEWLSTKGFPGTYLIESLKYCYDNYKQIV